MALDINKILNRAVNNVLYENEDTDENENFMSSDRKKTKEYEDEEEEKERKRSQREANEYNKAQSMNGANPRRDAQRDGPSTMDTVKANASRAGWNAGNAVENTGQWMKDHPVSTAAGAGAAAALAAGAGAMKLAKWVKEKRKASGKK